MTATTDNQKELFVVVDGNDRVLGYRSRWDCHHDKSLIHRVVNIALFNPKGEILLQKRSATKDLYPGYYALTATGHCSKGESWQETAVRELGEEMGITGVSLALYDKKIVAAEYETEMMALFRGEYAGEAVFFPEEVDGVMWVARENITPFAQKMTPCSRESLKLLKWI